MNDSGSEIVARARQGLPELVPARRKWAGLIFISLGVAMIIVDSTIVNVAIPQVIKDLGITSTDAQWVQDVYTLVFAALLLTAGRVADRLGRRLVFVAGIVVFVAGSVLAALAGSGVALIASRVVQGVGGAMILPTSLSLLNAGFRGRERGIAFAVWGSTIGGTAALGPLLGGWLTTSFSWRWAFGINVPIGVAVIAGLLLLVPESRGSEPERGNDVAGAVLTAIGLAGIVFALIEGRSDGWWTRTRPVSLLGVNVTTPLSPVPVAAAIGAASLVAFAFVERRRNRLGQAVLLDFRLFSIPSFRNGNIAAAIVSLGEFGILFALPLWIENVLGLTAFDTGLILLPLAVGSFAASGFGAQVGATRGALFVVRLGIALEIAGVLGLGLAISAHTAPWELVIPLFVYGTGIGLATAQLTGVVLADVPVSQSGQGSGTQSTARQIGSALGIAILGTILFSVLGSQLRIELASSGLPPAAQAAIATSVKDSAGASIPALKTRPATALAARDAQRALSTAARWTAVSAAGFLVLGLVASLSLGASRRRPATLLKADRQRGALRQGKANCVPRVSNVGRRSCRSACDPCRVTLQVPLRTSVADSACSAAAPPRCAESSMLGLGKNGTVGVFARASSARGRDVYQRYATGLYRQAFLTLGDRRWPGTLPVRSSSMSARWPRWQGKAKTTRVTGPAAPPAPRNEDINAAGRGSAEEQEKVMRVLGYVAAITVAAALGVMVVRSLPDVRLCVAMRNM